MRLSDCCVIILLHLTIVDRYSGGNSGADIGGIISGYFWLTRYDLIAIIVVQIDNLLKVQQSWC